MIWFGCGGLWGLLTFGDVFVMLFVSLAIYLMVFVVNGG